MASYTQLTQNEVAYQSKDLEDLHLGMYPIQTEVPYNPNTSLSMSELETHSGNSIFNMSQDNIEINKKQHDYISMDTFTINNLLLSELETTIRNSV